jgi:MFS family permease
LDTLTPPPVSDFSAALKVANIRYSLGAIGFTSFASRALMVIIGFQIYQITHSVLSLGWLGLIEAIPAISLAPFGGYVADHFNRRRILLTWRLVVVFCALALAFFSWQAGPHALVGLYGMIFLAGVARSFLDPATTAFEAQVVPKHLTVNASSWLSSTWILSSILGAAVIGFIYDAWGPAKSYLLMAGFFLLSWVCTVVIVPAPQIMPPQRETLWEGIRVGWVTLFKIRPLVGAMALDMFSVFFGGAISLLPVYASDILHVGAKGLGFLNAAPSAGALVIMLIATRHSPIARAGRNLFLAVAGFGASILVFAFSKNIFLSLAALFCSGAFDGLSVVIRRSIQRLLSPDQLRGRIASVSSIFICASNELGGFESGLLAAAIGTVPCVAAGGLLTFAVVGIVAKLSPQLRGLRFNIHTLERLEAPVELVP